MPNRQRVLHLLHRHALAGARGQESIYLGLPLAKAGLVLFIWAACHHFCAGIRYLLLDLNKGIELAHARASSWAVLAVSLLLTAYFGAKLW